MRRICSLATALGLAAASALTAVGPLATIAHADTVPPDCTVSPFGKSATWAGLNTTFVDGVTPAATWSRSNYRVSGTAFSSAGVGYSPSSDPTVVAATSTTAADLDGDGTKEIIRATQPAAGTAGTTLTPFRHQTSPTKLEIAGSSVTLPRYQDIAVAGGRFVEATDSTTFPREQVGVIGRTATGAIEVKIYGGSASALAPTPLFQWSSSSVPFGLKSSAKLLDATFADIDADGQQELVTASVNNLASGLQVQAFGKTGVYIETGDARYGVLANASVKTPSSTQLTWAPRHLRIVGADFDGDFDDELAIAWNDENTGTVMDEIHLETLQYAAGAFQVTGWRDLLDHPMMESSPREWDIATADVDSDNNAELIVAYPTSQTNLAVRALIARDPALPTRTTWNTTIASGAYYAGAEHLALGRGDMNKDGRDDVALAFSDRAGMQRTFALTMRQGTTSLASIGSQTTTSQAKPVDVVVADWDNSSVRTVYSAPPGMARCADVNVPTLLSAIDAAPTWPRLQREDLSYTGIGQGKDVSSGQAYTHTESVNISTSLEVGLSHEAKIDIVPGVLEFGAEVSESAVEQYQRENGRLSSTDTTEFRHTESGWNHMGMGRHVRYATLPYRCYFYQAYIVSAQNEWETMCVVRPMDDNNAPTQRDATLWDLENGPIANPAASRAWVPVAPEWSNLALQRPASAMKTSSGSSPQYAADADGDGRTSWRSSNEDSPYWQVDLGKTESISSVVVHPQTLSCTAICLSNPDFPRDIKVFVFDKKQYADIRSPDELAQQPGVRSFFWAGPAFGPLSFETRLDADDPINPAVNGRKKDPVKGRYVRVQRIGLGSLGLSDVQIFPSQTYVDPVRYPEAVEPIPGNTDFFRARVWIDYLKNYKWIMVGGQLVYDGADPDGVINVSQGAQSGSTWDLTSGTEITLTDGRARSTGFDVGGSVEGQVGLNMLSVTAGLEVTHGTTTEDTTERTSTVGNSLTTYGWYYGLETSDPHWDPVTQTQEPGWAPAPYKAPDQCGLAWRPFDYYAKAQSNYGVTQTYLVVSHLIRERTTATGFSRTEDLSNCRDGIRRRNGDDNAPVVSPFAAGAGQGTASTIDVVARATDPDNADITEILRVADVATSATSSVGSQATTAMGGQVAVRTVDVNDSPIDAPREVVYTPPAGFTGVDTFYVRVTDGDKLSQRADAAGGNLGKVTVTVGQAPELMQNGNLESGYAPWTLWNSALWIVSSTSHSGTRSLGMGVNGQWASTSLTVPTTAKPTLSFWLKVAKSSTGSGTRMDLQVIDGATTTTLQSWGNADDTAGSWVQRSFDLSQFAGKAVTVKFVVSQATSYITNFRMDDFSFTAW